MIRTFRVTARLAAAAAIVASGLLFSAGALAQHEEHEHAAPAGHGDHAAPPAGGHAAPTGHGAGHAAPSAHGEHGAASGHSDHADHGPADINWFDFSKPKQPPYIAYLINFGILMWLFVRFGKKPLTEGLKNRRLAIKREIDEAQRIKKEADARAKKYQKKLKNLDQDREATREALVQAAAADKERIVREAEEKAARMERDAKALLESELRQVRQDLTHETAEISVAAAEELLKTRITQADHERLAEDFLQQLAARTSGGRPATPATTPPAASSGGGSSSSFNHQASQHGESQ